MHRSPAQPRRLSLLASRQAAAAVEFALVCAPFTIFLLAVMGAGLHFYVQQVLDFAVQGAARQVQLGHVPAGKTSADFTSEVFCPILGPLLSCANIFLDVHPVVDYQNLTKPGTPDAPDSSATTGFTFCPGQPGQLMYVHVVYLGPSIGGTLLGGDNAIVANIAFANENPVGQTVLSSNGC